MPTPGTRYDIAIRVRTIMQLFNSLDPSPFRERDLDPHTEEFVVGWARELPYSAPFSIVVELPSEEAVKPEAAGIGEAFANYFRLRAAASERDLRELFRVGWRSLAIGLVVLVGCLVGSQVVAKMAGNAVVARVLEESLIIVGWVANWRPLEIYLYGLVADPAAHPAVSPHRCRASAGTVSLAGSANGPATAIMTAA